MAFYKLYHRHTACGRMMRDFDEVMRPEYHAKKRKEMQRALKNMLFVNAMIEGMSNSAGGRFR